VYIADPRLVIFWPENTEFLGETRTRLQRTEIRQIIQPLQISDAAGLGDLRANVRENVFVGGLPGIYLERPVRVQLFAYIVAIAPMLLAGAALVHNAMQLKQQKRSARQQGNQSLPIVPLEFAAALLAILSLRQVLVPGNI
jgi:hypothetical protein